MVVAVVGLSGAVGSDSQPRPVTQLTSNVGGVGDPFVDVSRTLQRVSRTAAPQHTP
jgi:hypothetical protein